MAKYITKDYLEQQFSHFKAQVADEKYIQIGKLKVNGTAISADDQKELNIEVPSAVSYRLALQPSPEAGFVATYNLQSKGTSEGEWSNVENSSKINIPKDYLIKSISEILTVVEADKAPGGKFETDASYAVGDKYVDFTVNSIGNDGVASHMYLKLTGTSITVDSALSDSSENPVQNKVIKSALDNKVDKVQGKGLSTNDYTNEEKSKLNSIPSGAEANVQADWNEEDTTSDAYIKNKPTIPEGSVVDSELSDSSRNPVQNKVVKAAIDNKVDKAEGKGLSTNDYTNEEKNKLAGISEGAKANVQADWEENDTTSDAYIKNKPTIPEGAVVDPDFSDSSTNPVQNKVIKEALDNKVDKVEGKGLSTNDYTNEEKSKLAGIPSGAEANVQSDWNVTDSSSDAFIKNKPEIPEAVTVDSELSSSSTNPVQNKVVKGALDNKIDKNGTDSLMTAEEHTKLGGMTAGAEPNKINSISLNGTNVAPDANKNVALTVITKAVNDLTNYYLKSETYTKTEINNIISNVKNGRFEVVQSLPTTDIDTATIYLVPKASAQTQNIYDEYICLNATTSPATWEKIGDTQIDLSNYVQKSSTVGLLKNDGTVDTNSYAKTSALNSYIAKSSTGGLVKNDGTIDTTTYATSASLNNKADKVSGATNGNLAGLNDSGNLTDSEVKASNVVQKSSTAGLLKNDGTVDSTQYATQSSITNITNVIPTEASDDNKLATASDILEKRVDIVPGSYTGSKYYKIYEHIINTNTYRMSQNNNLLINGSLVEYFNSYLIQANSHFYFSLPLIQGIIAFGSSDATYSKYVTHDYEGRNDIIIVRLYVDDGRAIIRVYVKCESSGGATLYIHPSYAEERYTGEKYYGTVYTNPTPEDEIIVEIDEDHLISDERVSFNENAVYLRPHKKISGSVTPNASSTTSVEIVNDIFGADVEVNYYCQIWDFVPEDITINRAENKCTIVFPKYTTSADFIYFYLKVYW